MDKQLDSLVMSSFFTNDEIDTCQKMIKRHPVIDIIHFVKVLGVDVYIQELDADKQSGVLCYNDGVKPYIIVDNRYNEVCFNRLAIAHKLGEYLFLRKNGFSIDPSVQYVQSIAMYIAKQTLVPTEPFVKVVYQSYRYIFIKFLLKLGFIDSDEYCIRKNTIIAKYFKVPYKVIIARKYDMDVLHRM